MRALVTGATGFLGSHLVEMALAAGYQVRALARNQEKARFLAAAGAEVVLGDLTAAGTLEGALQGCDVVFHAAALVTNWAPWRDYVRTTIQGTEALLRASARAGVDRFIHVSTIRVYDDRHCRIQRIACEDTPTGPCGHRHFGHYALAKLRAEEIVWQWHARGDVRATILRPAWIYGPRDEGILPPLIRYLRGRNAFWPSRTDPCADPIYVTDVAACALAAARADVAIGQAYNVAPTREIRLREFLVPLCNTLEIRPPRRALPITLTSSVARLSESWARWTFRRTAPTITRAGLAILTQDIHHSSAKAQSHLDWRPRMELEDGIRLTAAWLREKHPSA